MLSEKARSATGGVLMHAAEDEVDLARHRCHTNPVLDSTYEVYKKSSTSVSSANTRPKHWYFKRDSRLPQYQTPPIAL